MGWSLGRYRVLVEGASGVEVEEVPVYRSRGGRLFKTLLSSACRLDCGYCPFSRYCRVARERWEPGRLVAAFLSAYEMGVVDGLFLSSGLYGDPERVVEDMLWVVGELRRRGYRGYVALRLMPGTPGYLVREAARLADRVGVNLEAPGPSELAEVAPSKGSWSLDLLQVLLKAAGFKGDPRGVSTQFVLGVAGESDEAHVRLAYRLLRSGVGVVYYSPYRPVPGTPLASRLRPVPQARARRLHEAVALMRNYGFRPEWILDAAGDDGMLPLHGPSLKELVARLHPEWFPVDVEEASWRELARVPGVSPRAARRIVEARESGARVTPGLLARLLGRRRAARALRYLDLPARGLSAAAYTRPGAAGGRG